VVEEGRHCVDHGKTHLAYRWYVRQRRSADPGKSARQGQVPALTTCATPLIAAYHRLSRLSGNSSNNSRHPHADER